MRDLFFRLLCALALVLAPWLIGCGGHEARTLKMRTALDVGDAKGAIKAINEEMEVGGDKDLPKDIKGDNALLVLDRGSVQQGLVQFDLAKQDFEAADKAIDMLDLAHNAGDSIGEYVFSGSSGKYQAPPYEKLMINTLNMLNYLEQKDLSGAKVEARRLATYQKYYKDTLKQPDNPVLGLGSVLAGFAYEKAGDYEEALRYYDDAMNFPGYAGPLGESVARIASSTSFQSPHIKAAVERNHPPPKDDASGEILFVMGYGRVPHKIGERMPIGLVLTLFADSISPADREAANKLALQGLVTWINYPTLAPGQGNYAVPNARLDNATIEMQEVLNVDKEVRTEWKRIEGKIILSALTRMIARFAVGQGIQTAAGRDNVGGLIASLATQATLTALDTPDTRSWETLPARIAIARVRVPPGRHRIAMNVRGWQRTQEIMVEKGGWQVVSLMALR